MFLLSGFPWHSPFSRALACGSGLLFELFKLLTLERSQSEKPKVSPLVSGLAAGSSPLPKRLTSCIKYIKPLNGQQNDLSLTPVLTGASRFLVSFICHKYKQIRLRGYKGSVKCLLRKKNALFSGRLRLDSSSE